MDDLGIDETLPGQEIEDENDKVEIRRENDSPASVSNFGRDEMSIGSSDIIEQESLRGWLYLVAGAGYGTLVVYLVLVIQINQVHFQPQF